MTFKYEADARAIEAPDGLVWLVEVEVPSDPLTRFRITSDNEPVYYGESTEGVGNVYYPYPVQVGQILRQKKGDLPQISVSVSNARRILPEYLELYDGLVGQPAIIRLVSLGELGNYEAALRYDGEVTGTEATVEQVNFVIGSFNPKGTMFPRERFTGEHCPYAKFGGPECGYPIDNPSASFTTCPRTYAACDERGDDEDTMGVDRQHPDRFGGWRSIPLG